MNDLIRPALYGSKHKIIPLKEYLMTQIEIMNL